MCCESGGNNTLYSAKQPDPSESRIRNPHSPERCLLAPSDPLALSARAVSVGWIWQAYQVFICSSTYNIHFFNNLFP